jgi:hypothetical protein
MEGEDLWTVFQAALLDGPADADYGEVRGVLEFFVMNEDEILGAMDLDPAQRGMVAQRLGLHT